MIPASAGSRATERSHWLVGFLVEELTPYPGRLAIVARMVVASTLTMLVIQIFRIPGGGLGPLFAFILSRENLRTTTRSALVLLYTYCGAALFVPIGARMFASEPMTHFLWEAASLFVIFFLLRTMTDYAVAVGYTIITMNILPIWYLPGPAERNLELTLWQVLVGLIGLAVTFMVEAVFTRVYSPNELSEGLFIRWEIAERALRELGDAKKPHSRSVALLTQYSVTGTGSLRSSITRGRYSQNDQAKLHVVVSLTDRIVANTAAILNFSCQLNVHDQRNLGNIANRLAMLRRGIESSDMPSIDTAPQSDSESLPLIREIDSLISNLLLAYRANESVTEAHVTPLSGPSRKTILSRDAFSNPDHARYATVGTLAAMVCYICYVVTDWPGIATSVTTCVITALTTAGASRQKQALRLGGAMLGGLVFGIGGQVFVLPGVDSIGGFAVYFALVTGLASWIATSSGKLAYAGVQLALAFYLINVGDFSIQTSLALARDRVIGIALGSTAMWLLFERLYQRKASEEMMRLFIANLRLIAELITRPSGGGGRKAVDKIQTLRDTVYSNFNEISAQADAVPFEAEMREHKLAVRDRVRRWQARLRLIYMHEVSLLQLRTTSTVEISREIACIDHSFHHETSRKLLSIADWLDQSRNDQSLDPVKTTLSWPDLPLETDSVGISRSDRLLVQTDRLIASLIEDFETDVRNSTCGGLS